jgi:hypothetical protein
MKVRLLDPHSMDLVDIQVSNMKITIIYMLNIKGVKRKKNKNLTIVTLKDKY